MSLWAVEATFAQAQNHAVQALLDRLRPSLAILGDVDKPTGAATLLDAGQGLFLAHRDAVPDQGGTIRASTTDGRIRLRVVARDIRTGLALLEQEGGEARAKGTPITVAEGNLAPNAPIVVLLADGALGASFVGGQKILLMGERRHAVPASEIRFESPAQLVAGALLLSLDGRLVGTIGATVPRAGNAASATPKTLAGVRELVQGRGTPGSAPAKAYSFGPQGLTVAWTPNLTAVRLAVSGFRSKDNRPDYAGLGVVVKETPIGVIVQSVTPDTPASRVGIRVNDVLLALGDRPIRGYYDFVQALYSAKPGDETTVRVRHDGTEVAYRVVLARTK